VRFDRSVHHEGLSAEQVAQLQGRAAELAMAMLHTLHAEAEAMTAGSGKSQESQRFTCGIYWFDGEHPSPDEAEVQE
jgi:hypothetical protein